VLFCSPHGNDKVTYPIRNESDPQILMSCHRNADEKIKEAIAKGEFDNLPGKGKPLDLDAYFATPEHLRMGYSILKSAGIIPEEVELLKQIIVEFDFDASNSNEEARLLERFAAEGRDVRDLCAALLLHLAEKVPLALAVHSGGKSLHGWFYCAEVPEEKAQCVSITLSL